MFGQAGTGLALGWTPDVFGGERLELLVAQAQLTGRQHDFDALRLALAANTESAYVDLRWAQSEQKILQDNVEIRERALRLTQEPMQYGPSPCLDVTRAQNQLSELQARLPHAAATIQHQLSLIAVYSGRTPESVDVLVLATPVTIPTSSSAVPQMLPSEALMRRPDVRSAYAELTQRAAEVGVAQAYRYPKFSLQLTDGLLASSYRLILVCPRSPTTSSAPRSMRLARFSTPGASRQASSRAKAACASPICISGRPCCRC